MGVGLVRSLQHPDILLIHWRVYNSTANTSKGVLFLPPSDAYVRSFLYLLYTLIKLNYTKALSDQASSLAPDWILLVRRPRIPASLRGSAKTFQTDGKKVGGKQLNWAFTAGVSLLVVLFDLRTGLSSSFKHCSQFVLPHETEAPGRRGAPLAARRSQKQPWALPLLSFIPKAFLLSPIFPKGKD